MGLTQKILLFTSAIVVSLVAISVVTTTVQSDRLARTTINQGLKETREIWETFEADRYNKLKLGVRVMGNDSPFKAAIVQVADEGEAGIQTVFDLLKDRGRDLGADFFLATGRDGVLIARSDRPGVKGEALSRDPIVMKALSGEESATVWRQGDQLVDAVSVPMAYGGDIVGVLVAGYGINEALAGQIQKLTHSEIAFLTTTAGQPPQLAVSSLGIKESAFRAALGRPELAKPSDASFSVNLGGDDYIAVQMPLKAAGGDTVGAVVALRSLSKEKASFRQFRNTLIFVSLGVMALALGLAYAAATRITRPVRTLVSLVERAREGSFSGAVSVATQDEIGSLARAFNALLADLREKDQMIGFLREGMTMLKKGGPSSTSTLGGDEATTSLEAVTPTRGVMVEKGTLFAGRYEILGTVGKGGMGVVFRARDKQLDEVVALKVLRGEMLSEDPTMLERFKQEIKLARRITNRNVLRTHDFGETEGTFYISMEFLEGVTLKDLIRSKGAMPAGVGLSIAKQMCHGLEAAHEQGVVHRDIKPQNMLILPETAELKIMDFGIARRSEVEGGAPGSGLTTAGMVMGTPDYMPPEQAQGEPADFRSDIYSLGVVLFESFTGKLPFTGDTLMKIVMAHIQSPPPRPRSVNPRIPTDLEAVILKCLEKDPNKRYQKVSELLEALTGISSRATEAA